MKDAIQHLVNLGAAQQIGEKLPTQAAALPQDHRIEDFEHLLPFPIRYRTKISTHSLDDFVDVTNAENSRLATDGGAAPCFIDDEKMSATAIFNLGTFGDPGHGDHKAILTLRKTVEFQELLRIDGGRMDQKTAAEWLEDWRDFLTPVWEQDIGERANMASAINVVRNVSIEATVKAERSVTDFGAEKSDLEKIEARGRDLPIPARFVFKCAPYQHLSERDIALRLSLTTGDKPQLTLRIIRLDSLQDELMEEFRTVLSGKLDDGVKVIIGTINK